MKRHVSQRLLMVAALPLLAGGCAVPVSATEGETAAAPANEQVELGDVKVRVLGGKAPEDKPTESAAERPCAGSVGQGALAELEVTPGPGTANVAWYHPGDTSVVGYRLTAISQTLPGGEQPELRWQEVAAPEGCTKVVATVTALERNIPYVFSLDAVRVTSFGDSVRSPGVARSSVVSTT